MENIYLQFDFNEQQPVAFKNPITIIYTYELSEVVPCLQKVEQYIQAGYYAGGFLTYEAAPAFDPAFQVHTNGSFPLIWFGIFSEAEAPHKRRVSPFAVQKWQMDIKEQEYKQQIEHIKQQIEEGHTYQVNYTIPLKSYFTGDSFAYYEQLAASQAANYAAYLQTGNYSILSASPELFFHLKKGVVTTKPMKGTAKRGSTIEEDKANADWLYYSEKNRAENVMIVDLLRNDLSRIAKRGTVRVPELFTIERYPTVFQMTSTVTAEVETNLTSIFEALFPCGSITGAPKVSTMNIIRNIEKTPRNIYCGAIGYITPEHEAIFNVPIRTVSIDNTSNEATYGVGGGITWDSTTEEEYEEMLAKTLVLEKKKNSFDLLESIRLENGCYPLLAYHLNRMEKSATHFSYPFDPLFIKQKLEQIAQQSNTGVHKLRLLLSKTGQINLDLQPISMLKKQLHVRLATRAINKTNPFFYHKTTNREIYEAFLTERPDADDVLLWNDELQITEFTIGNVVVEIDKKYYTPPVECGLLPGTFRQYVLETKEVQEKIITITDLQQISNIWLINSVRGWVPVTIEREQM